MAANGSVQFLRAPKAFVKQQLKARAPVADSSGGSAAVSERDSLVQRKLGSKAVSALPSEALECLPDADTRDAAAHQAELDAKLRHEGHTGQDTTALAASRDALHTDVVAGMCTDVQPCDAGAAVVQILSARTRVPSNLGPAVRVLRVMMDADEDGDAMSAARRHARFIMRSGHTSLPCYVVPLGKPFVPPLSDADAVAAVPTPVELPVNDVAYAEAKRRRDVMRDAVLTALRADNVASRAVAMSYGRDAVTVERGFQEQARTVHLDAYKAYCQAHPQPAIPKDLDDAFPGVAARVPAESCGLVGVKKAHRDMRQDDAALCGVATGLDLRIATAGAQDGPPDDTVGLQPWFMVLGAALSDGASQEDVDNSGLTWQKQVVTRVVHIARMYEWIFVWGKDKAPRVDPTSEASRAVAKSAKERAANTARTQRMRSMLATSSDKAEDDAALVNTGSNNDDPLAPIQRAAAGCVQRSGFARVVYST